MKKIVSTLAIFFVLSSRLAYAQFAPSPAPAPKLKIGGAVQTPLALAVADLKKMPRKTLLVTNPHSLKKETYEGVALEEILRKAGVPSGEHLRGSAMTIYVIA